MENNQSNLKIQDAHIWYDEKLKSHFLFFAIDGIEKEGTRITPLDAAKVRDGVISVESLVAKYNPWLIKGKATENQEVKDSVESSKEQNKPQVNENLTYGERFRSTLKNLGINLYQNTVKFSSWVADILNLAWNDDNIGAYKEFAKGVDYAEKQVGKAVDFLGLENVIAKARTYQLSLYDMGGQLLRADFTKAREAAKPITADLKALGNFVFVRSGIWPAMKNLANRTPETTRAMGGAFKGNKEEAKQAGKLFIQETGRDMKGVLHSEAAHKTIESVLTGMEKLEKATKVGDEQIQIQNRKREDELTIKHPRLSQVRIYANRSGMDHFIRCCIDGVQQMGKPLKEQDYTSWELGSLDRYQLAEKYYDKDLQTDLVRVAGVSR